MQRFPGRTRWWMMAVLAAGLQAAAQAEESAMLREVAVQSGRSSVVDGNPSASAQVTAEDMRDINVTNVEDALRYVPSLHVRKRYIGDRNSIVASRTSGTQQSARSLVYADGLLLSNLLGNSFAYPPRWNMVGAEEVESIDVLYGPFSALLPGNAAGATVLMTTRQPQQFEAHARAQVFTQHYSLYGTDASFGGHQEQAFLGGREGALSWSLMLNHLDSKSQPMSFVTAASKGAALGSDAVVSSGYYRDKDPAGKDRVILGATSIDRNFQDIAKLRVAYDFSRDTRAAVTLAQWRNDSYSNSQTYLRGAAGNDIWSSASGNVNIDGRRYGLAASAFAPSDRNEENRLLGLTLESRLNAQWRLETAVSKYDTLRDVTRAPTVARPAADAGGTGNITFADGTGWQNLDLRAIWTPAGSGHKVTFGYHYDEYTLRSLRYGAANWHRDGSIGAMNNLSEGKTRTDAFYVQDAWKLAPRWELTLGLRHENWQAYDGRIFTTALGDNRFASRNQGFTSPKASLAWQATPDWLLRLSLAQAYRMPTVSELFQTESRGNATAISDPNLKPENVFYKDLTAEGSALGGNLRVSLFEEVVRDALYSQTDINLVTSNQNVDKVRARGVETAYQAKNVGLAGLDLGGSLTYTDARILENHRLPSSQGRVMPRIPDWRLSLLAAYRIDERWTASAGLKYSGRQFNTLDNSDTHQDTFGGTSRYTTLDTRLSYRFHKLMSASIGIDNLTNEKYYVFHPYPQRTVHAELRMDY